jgi:hypothetical protein
VLLSKCRYTECRSVAKVAAIPLLKKLKILKFI